MLPIANHKGGTQEIASDDDRRQWDYQNKNGEQEEREIGEQSKPGPQEWRRD